MDLVDLCVLRRQVKCVIILLICVHSLWFRWLLKSWESGLSNYANIIENVRIVIELQPDLCCPYYGFCIILQKTTTTYCIFSGFMGIDASAKMGRNFLNMHIFSMIWVLLKSWEPWLSNSANIIENACIIIELQPDLCCPYYGFCIILQKTTTTYCIFSGFGGFMGIDASAKMGRNYLNMHIFSMIWVLLKSWESGLSNYANIIENGRIVIELQPDLCCQYYGICKILQKQ